MTTLRLRTRPLCPVCGDLLRADAWALRRGIALCCDCYHLAFLQLHLLFRIVRHPRITRHLTNEAGITFWTPRTDRTDKFDAFNVAQYEGLC